MALSLSGCARPSVLRLLGRRSLKVAFTAEACEFRTCHHDDLRVPTSPLRIEILLDLRIMLWPSRSGRHGEHLLLCLSRCCCMCATKRRPHQSTAMRSVYLGVLSSGQAAARRHARGVGSAEAGTGAAWGACLSDAADAERLRGGGRTEEIRIVPFCPTVLNIFTTRQASLAG